MTTSAQRRPATLMIALALATGMVSAKPDGAFIVTASPSTLNMKTGEVVTTTLQLVAREDVDYLKVTVSAVTGIEIVSEQTVAEFRNIKKGDKREMQVTVRLIAPKYGDLAVVYQAIVRGDQDRGGVSGVTYGNPKS